MITMKMIERAKANESDSSLVHMQIILDITRDIIKLQERNLPHAVANGLIDKRTMTAMLRASRQAHKCIHEITRDLEDFLGSDLDTYISYLEKNFR